MRLLFFVLVVLGGAGLSLQMAWNARLREATGSPILAVLISLCVSLIAVLGIWASGLFSRGSLPRWDAVPAWSWMGGLFAALYLLASLLAIPRYGAAIVISLVVAGQMAAALFLDSTGAFGVHETPLTAARALGAILVVAGVAAMQMK